MPVAPATPNFPPGHVSGLTWTPNGGVETTVNIVSADATEKVDVYDTTHTGSLGVQWSLAGIFREDGTITLMFDLANKPSTLNLKAGTRGVFKEYLHVANGVFYSVPVLIESVNRKTAVGDKGMVTITYKLDGSAGTYVYP
jgi:hypothetical protein